MKVLNLYAGIGGNRKLWEDVEVTSVEINEEIAGVYKSIYPQDTIIVSDAHQYLLDHYKEFDFIWSSPPCPTHSRLCFSLPLKTYPSMVLYKEIIFLKNWFKGKWCVENVIPYYDALIKPSIELNRHYFWSNFNIHKMLFENKIDISRCTPQELSDYLGIGLPNCKKARTVLRNCVLPKVGLHVFNCAFKEKQQTL